MKKSTFAVQVRLPVHMYNVSGRKQKELPKKKKNRSTLQVYRVKLHNRFNLTRFNKASFVKDFCFSDNPFEQFNFNS